MFDTNDLQLYNLSAKQWTYLDLYQQKEIRQSTDDSPIPKERKSETQLIEGAKYLIGVHKTAENLVVIVDQVIRDHNNRQVFYQSFFFTLK